MSTRSLDVMKSKPGVYIVTFCHGFFFVEVDATGRVWQLSLLGNDYARDAELVAEAWNAPAVARIDGPFQRTTPKRPVADVAREQALAAWRKAWWEKVPHTQLGADGSRHSSIRWYA